MIRVCGASSITGSRLRAIDQRRVLFVADGRDANTVAAFADDLDIETARAYRLRLAFQDIYDQPSPGWGELILDRWYSWAIRSRLEPMKDAARTIMRHRDGILRWFTSKIANGLIEGINSLVQAAKAKARGYLSTRNLKAITYLIAGKLDLRLPT
jgi:transposase